MRTEEEIRKQKNDIYAQLYKSDIGYDYAMGYIAALEFVLEEE